MVHNWYDNNKKRREQQVRLLKRGIEPVINYANRSMDTFPWNQMERKTEGKSRLLVQSFLSVLLLCSTYLVIKSQSPQIQPYENVVVNVMTRDFNFDGLSTMYQKYVGNNPSVLPAFFHHSTPKPLLWKTPVKGKIILPYNDRRKGIVIQPSVSTQVMCANEGWVSFAGYKDGLGNTIIVRHSGGQETWYGWLKEVRVKEKDWVKSGQNIGLIGKVRNQELMFFALRKDKQFINPTGVIPFE